MTLDESKKVKRMRIEGRIDGNCLMTVWFRICIFPGVSLSRADGNGYIPFEYDGDPEKGQFIMGEIAEIHREKKRHCRMAINYYYV